jgi:hypothetical protein
MQHHPFSILGQGLSNYDMLRAMELDMSTNFLSMGFWRLHGIIPHSVFDKGVTLVLAHSTTTRTSTNANEL